MPELSWYFWVQGSLEFGTNESSTPEPCRQILDLGDCVWVEQGNLKADFGMSSYAFCFYSAISGAWVPENSRMLTSPHSEI